MTYQQTVEQKPGYQHFRVTGEKSRENVSGYIREIARVCMARGCSRVLIEERLEGSRLDMMEVFDIAAMGSSHALGLLKELAYVDVHAAGDFMRFAETVANNRMMPVRIFPSVAEAERWLLRNGLDGVARESF